MGSDRQLRGSHNPIDLLRTSRYVSADSLAHPDRLDSHGIIVFCGVQGSGKTLSAVQYVQALAAKYPHSVLVSNIDIISGLPDDYSVLPWRGVSSLTDVNNGEFGVIYLLDELHLLFNSLESKGIPLEVFTTISQQRKQRKLIIGTSQLFLRLAKPFREQAQRLVLCSSFRLGPFVFPHIQFNTVLDGATLSEQSGEVSGSVLGRYFWFHTPELYNSYDTYALVRRSSDAWKQEGFAGAPLPYSDLFSSPSSGVRS